MENIVHLSSRIKSEFFVKCSELYITEYFKTEENVSRIYHVEARLRVMKRGGFR
jgi:hypothetical protein